MKTAAANMSLSYDTSQWETATVDSMIPATDMLLFLFGNPLRSYIQFEHNPSHAVFTYDVQAVDGTYTWPLTSLGVSATPLHTELIPRWATCSTAFQPHGAILFPGYDNAGHYYLWVDSGSASTGLVVHLAVPPVAVNSGLVRWFYWTGKTAAPWGSMTITTGQQDYATSPPAGGAYMYAVVIYTETAIVGQAVSLSVHGNQPVWGHHCVSDINSLLGQAYGIRVNSASVRVQNDSSPLYRDGKIVSVTVGPGTCWASVSQSTDFLAHLQGFRQRTADKGYYGVVLPNSDADVSEFYDDIAASASSSDQTLYQAAYPLAERRPFKAIGLTVEQTQGRAITIDVTHTLQYLSNNKLISQNNSRVAEPSLDAAIVIASTMDTDYDNPVHWRDILQTIATFVPLGTKALISALQLFNYNSIASQLEARQPIIERLADNFSEISAASTKNKRGSER